MSSHHARQPQAALDILKHSVCSGLVGSFLSVQFLAIAVQQHELLIAAELLSRALTSFLPFPTSTILCPDAGVIQWSYGTFPSCNSWVLLPSQHHGTL